MALERVSRISIRYHHTDEQMINLCQQDENRDSITIPSANMCNDLLMMQWSPRGTEVCLCVHD